MHDVHAPIRRWWRAGLRAAGLVAALALSACASPPTAPLPTVASVDLDRYQGRWWEVASLPNPFQSRCVAATQAEYRLEGDRVRVRNECLDARGERLVADGLAEPLPGSGNARLRVSFFRPFWGDYWVLALDPAYRWVLVGEPGRRYAWVLSREPALPEAELQALLDRAAALGFDRTAFRRTPASRP